MKAGVYYGVEDFRVAEFPEPELKEDGVKIAVKYCGVCGTDVHKFHGQCGSHPMKPPVPLGHEVSGVVVETGKHVTHFKVGDVGHVFFVKIICRICARTEKVW